MSRFKVLLVYPNLQMVNLLPNNIAILSACLKEANIEVRLFDTTLYRTQEKSVDEVRVDNLQLRPFNLEEKEVYYKTTDIFDDFDKVVREYGPDLVGVSATDDTFELGMKLISRINDKRIHVIAGGVFPTLAPEKAIQNSRIDSIAVGEGEEALVELCRALQSGGDFSGIKNLWVKVSGRIHKNALRRPVDLEALPFEDFDIFEEKRFFRPMQGKVFRMIPVSLDRGCPYACAFCAAPALREVYSNAGVKSYFRIKSASKIMAELKHQINKYRADYIYFNSETFFVRPDSQIEPFASEYADTIGLPFWCQTRVETITEKRVKMLKAMNCDRISIGIEHGNEAFRKDYLKKNFTNAQVLAAFKIIEKSGISVTVNNIIGFPDETRELVFDTIRLNRLINPDSINAYFFMPYQGTPLREYCLEKGYITKDEKTDSLMRRSILRMPHFPQDEIKGLVRTFPLYVKMPETYFAKIKIAERFDEDGEKAFAELRQVYSKEYFN